MVEHGGVDAFGENRWGDALLIEGFCRFTEIPPALIRNRRLALRPSRDVLSLNLTGTSFAGAAVAMFTMSFCGWAIYPMQQARLLALLLFLVDLFLARRQAEPEPRLGGERALREKAPG